MWTATYDEPTEPITATGHTPEEAVAALQALLGESEDYPPLEVWVQDGRYWVADGPHLIGTITQN